ncbi:aprataxin-like protein, partial [Perkinsus olseni]
MSSLQLVKTCRDEYGRHPDRYRDAIIHKSEEGFTTVYDGYPKSTVHLLILPDQRIKTPQQLDRSGEFGTSFLRRVHKYADWLIGELHKQEHLRELEFKLGIHAVPSMEPFHVHIISTDMRSNRIKHKKHWNSFTTPFFVQLTQVEDILERDGNLHSILSRESHLRDDLLCNTCSRNFGSRFTKLMHHVTICSQREQLAVKRKAESEVA